jgi:general secretion pathway protein A
VSLRNHPLEECYASLGFNSVPFSITPDTTLAFPGAQYVSAFNQMYYGCTSGSLAVLSAEVGLGKTLLIRCLIHALPDHVEVAYLFNPLQDQLALLREIYTEFNGGDAPLIDASPSMHQALMQLILQGAAKGKRYVIIVDEAHRLGTEMLEVLRLLSNLETEQQKLISLVLAGQPELDKTLSLRAMRPLRERLGLWLRLTPMNRTECTAYVKHRIALTHRDGRFGFSSAAFWCLHWRTKGVPRRINLASERAVLLAYTRNTRRVTWSMVREACNEFTKAW